MPVDLPRLPKKEYGGNPQTHYSQATQLLTRYSINHPTLKARIQGIRTKEEAQILATAEAQHQARRPVIAAINQQHKELQDTDDSPDNGDEDSEKTVKA